MNKSAIFSILVLITGYVSASDLPRPEWSKRSSIKMTSEGKIRFLGRAEAWSRDKALSEAKQNGISNFIELSFPSISNTASSSVQNMSESRSQKQTILKTPKVMVKYDDFLGWCEKLDNGDWLCFVDVVIKQDSFERAEIVGYEDSYYKEKDLDVKDLNEEYKKTKTLKDFDWMISYSPFTGDGMYLMGLDVEKTFFNKIFFIGAFYYFRSDSPEGRENPSSNVDSLEREKQGAFLGVNLYRSYKAEFGIAGTYTNLKTAKILKSEERIKERDDELIGAQLIWRKLFINSRDEKPTGWGYTIRVVVDDVEAEDIKVNYTIGLSYSF